MQSRHPVNPSPLATSPLHQRARAYAKEHGLVALARTAFRTYVYERQPFYVYMCPHALTTQDVPMPQIEHFHAAFVASNDEADELARTHDDLRALDSSARSGLEHGAVALCLYSGGGLANVSWLATNRVARRAIDSIGFPIDSSVHGAWTGRVRTMPLYEGKGLFRYACAKRFEYLLSLGIDRSATSVAPGNTRSHAMSARLGCHLMGKGHVVRLLRWRWWRSGQLTRSDEEAVREAAAAAFARRDWE